MHLLPPQASVDLIEMILAKADMRIAQLYDDVVSLHCTAAKTITLHVIEVIQSTTM